MNEDLARNADKTVFLKWIYYLLEQDLGLDTTADNPVMEQLDKYIAELESTNIYLMGRDMRVMPRVSSAPQGPCDRALS